MRKQFTLIAIMMMVCISGMAQFWAELGAGSTNGFFQAELQGGYRSRNMTASVGYIALMNNTQPALFNVRVGYVAAERLHVYGGYVRVNYSSDDKSRNFNSWQLGAQYLLAHYDRGTMYAGTSYTGNNMLSFNVGFTYNLSQGLHL